MLWVYGVEEEVYLHHWWRLLCKLFRFPFFFFFSDIFNILLSCFPLVLIWYECACFDLLCFWVLQSLILSLLYVPGSLYTWIMNWIIYFNLIWTTKATAFVTVISMIMVFYVQFWTKSITMRGYSNFSRVIYTCLSSYNIEHDYLPSWVIYIKMPDDGNDLCTYYLLHDLW